MEAFVKSKGWYDKDSKRPQTPRNIACCLSIEASEVLEHFQWADPTHISDELCSNQLAGELADVALYLLQLAKLCKIDLEKAIFDKLQINYGRTWE